GSNHFLLPRRNNCRTLPRMQTRLAILFLACAVFGAQAIEPWKTMKLWPGKAPGEKGDIGPEGPRPDRPGQKKKIIRLANVSVPTLSVYKPKKPNGTAILICPGGGYSILAMDLEGTEVAEWLNSFGVTAIVLKYRVPRRKDREKHEAPLQDAQRSLGIVRHNAEAWGINPERIGILGFSAGGHLSATAMTNYRKRAYPLIDKADQINCRPDFGVLVYPAYLVDNETKTKLVPEVKITKDTPPAVFIHAGDDRITADGSVQMWLAMRRASVHSELHVFPHGGHGYGLRPSEDPVSKWPKLVEAWLKRTGLVK
ncbi:MAG: alpha/beta hydrolase, partial [Verrucomicrobiota bacterium]|nr:alpha/beta hydrolase [Verrucomicrobiota bacterium]